MSPPNLGRKVLASQDGSVLVLAKPSVTEKEIEEDRQLILQALDAAYLNLVDYMESFQREWDADPMWALVHSVGSGAAAGASAWGDDFADMLKKETWIELGTKIKKLAGDALDSAADNSRKIFNDIADTTQKAARYAGEVTEKPDKTVMNWAWWQANLEELEAEAKAAIGGYVDQKRKQVNAGVQAAGEAIEKARKIYKHREAILGLPELLVKGDPKPVQAFVDTVLMDIDPQVAKEIKEDPNFYMVLELISDHDSILSYLSYVGLAIEAIPPNFLGYLAGKGGAYLLIELVLLLVTAILSAGAATAARIATLSARLLSSGSRLANAAKKIEHAKEALESVVRVINDFYQATTSLRALGDKLRIARQRGLVLRGKTRTTIPARKQSIKRDKKCQLCGSTKHTTPRRRLGTVTY